MARKVLLETGYTFTPATKTITIPRVVPRERLVLITNVTTNQVIYNFSDPNLKAVSYSTSGAVNANTTTIVLNYNTASMTSTDKLQFLIDEYDEKFTPSEAYIDPVNKLRISSPQALIDTDFEYGTQVTKWENLATINNRPFAFQGPSPLANVSGITMSTGSRTVSVTLSSGTAPANGNPITVQDSFLSIANGNYIIESGGGTGTFTYTGRAVNTTGITNILDTNKTGIYTGGIYTNAAIGGTPTITNSGTAVTIVTTVPHGLAVGNEIALTGTSASTNAPNGSWVVATINNSTSFTVYVLNAPTGSITGGTVYVRPQAQFLHRPFDGGVIFTSNANANFEQATRQTRRYFRYQSGKGIQVSSGTILRPNLQIDSMSASGTTITVITKEQHNIQPGTTISVFGANETAYNGTFVVTSITGYNSFQYTALTTPSASPASGNFYVSVTNWFGAVNRLGIFDGQNGMYFEYDGQQLYAVRRSSTFQLSGKVTVTNGGNTISQTNASLPTYFAKQLQIGDFIVLRGQSYRVIDIASDTSMTISPSYRGATADYVIASKTVDTKIPQSQWNLDKCDGTGPSGFSIDLGRMQMFYIDYSWYGAGFIRWGFRGPDGNVLYCHKLANNNVNAEAYMRSGNLPARYESQSLPPTTYITSTLNSADTTISVASTAGFPSSGTLCLRNATVYEYANYSALGAGTSTFTGVRRAQSGVPGGVSLTVTSGSNVATAATTNIAVGMRVVSPAFPDGTFVSQIGSGTLTMSQAAVQSYTGVGVTIPAMGATSGQTFTYSPTDPVAVELAFPTFGPTVSHWGTSVIMDGRFDDDKSLVFTYGQRTPTTLGPSVERALFSIRVAPSIDNGQIGVFGQRELVNRMQLTLESLGLNISPIGIVTSFPSVLVRAYINATPSSSTAWTNAIGNVPGFQNSSLAQIADYAGGSTIISGGEVTAGFLANQTQTISLANVRDLGNSILGGGGTNANVQIYPDGPDVLTITATNVGPTSVQVFGRLSWTEAQA